MSDIAPISAITSIAKINSSNSGNLISIASGLLATKATPQTIEGVVTTSQDNNQNRPDKSAKAHGYSTITTDLGNLVVQGNIQPGTKVEIIAIPQEKNTHILVIDQDSGNVLCQGSVNSSVSLTPEPTISQPLGDRAVKQSDFLGLTKGNDIALQTKGVLEQVSFLKIVLNPEILEKEELNNFINQPSKAEKVSQEMNLQQTPSSSVHTNSNETHFLLKSGTKLNLVIRLALPDNNAELIPAKFSQSTSRHTILFDSQGLPNKEPQSSLRTVTLQVLSPPSAAQENLATKTKQTYSHIAQLPGFDDIAFITKKGTIILPATVAYKTNTLPYQQPILHSPIGAIFLASSSTELPDKVLIECNINELIRGELAEQVFATPKTEDSLSLVTGAMKEWLKKANQWLHEENNNSVKNHSNASKASTLLEAKITALASLFTDNRIHESLGAILRAFRESKSSSILHSSFPQIFSDKIDKISVLDQPLSHIYNQVNELNQPNNKWSFFILPTYNTQVFQHISLFVRNDLTCEQEEAEDNTEGRRVVVQLDSKDFGIIWIDTLLYKAKKRIDVILRSEKELGSPLTEGLINLFTSLKETLHLDGTLDVKTQANFTQNMEETWRHGLNKAKSAEANKLEVVI